jgi:single-stranded-DNA-specific exonuclease
VGQQFADTTRCSCRSIPEFHITKALDQCADLLIRYGGHAAAAGFTVRNDLFPELKQRLLSIANRQFDGQVLRRTLHADLEVSLSDLHSGLLKHLDALQPTGFGNPEAVFVSRNVTVLSSRVVGSDGKHLKLNVSDGRVTLDAIGFRLGAWQAQLPRHLDLVYTFEMNEFNGRSTLQLNVKDLKAAGTPD